MNTPETDAEFAFVTALNVATERVKEYPLYRKFIDGTPLSNDIAVWIAQAYIEGADFARTLEQQRDTALDALRETVTALEKLKQTSSVLRRGLAPNIHLWPEYQDFADACDQGDKALTTAKAILSGEKPKLELDYERTDCCGAPFYDPGYPDSDICSACKEHADPAEIEPDVIRPLVDEGGGE